MTTEINRVVESTLVFAHKPLVDLSKYDQSSFDRGRPSWFILLWWLIQAIAFPLSLHNFSSFRCWLLRLFGAKIGKKSSNSSYCSFYLPLESRNRRL